MNEELDSQLSAMFDDELPAAECELLARRLSRDEALKARWESYALIGAAIRAERGVNLTPVLARRVTQALNSEPPLITTAPPPKRSMAAWWQPVAGAAVAAGVAAGAIFWVRQAPLEAPRPLTQVAQSTPVTATAPAAFVASTPPVSQVSPSYIVPATSTRPRPVVVPSTRLANYLVAHFQVSSPVAGQAMLSALVAGDAGTAAAAPGSEELVPLEDLQDDAKTVE